MDHTLNSEKKMKLFILLALLLLISVPSYNQNIPSILNSFHNYDMDRDGTYEINELSYLPFERGSDGLNEHHPLVLVLVERRLLKTIPGSSYSENDLLSRLERYKEDLSAEGYFTRFISADLYAGNKHQDGQTLLAMREVLRKVNRSFSLQGVILVGSFPEAMLVRRWIWRNNRDITIDGTEYKGDNRIEFLRIVPETVAHRADLVLADLNGNWENIYEKGPKDLTSIEAIPSPGTRADWPSNNTTFTSFKYNLGKITFEDFFWIKEDDFSILSNSRGTLRLQLRTDQQHPEISRDDHYRPNPITIPDILISRINAKNVAVIPDPNFRGSINRQGFIGTDGRPQVVEDSRSFTPSDFLQKDPATERELLISYFDRNHSFRVGGNPLKGHRTAAASYGRGLIKADDLNAYLQKASNNFEPSLAFDDANLYSYVQFLKVPAVLKGMSAHSNPEHSEYGNYEMISHLENLVGGKPWRWKKDAIPGGFRYTPSLKGQGGLANTFLHRTIYENQILSKTGGNLFIHNGCEVNSPRNVNDVPYNHSSYGSPKGYQNAESILFFLNGVALASRAKVFYDKPEGFTDELGQHGQKRFGDGWKAYFRRESNNSDLARDVAGNKRTYNWSILGDWTVRVKYENGLGILKMHGNNLKDYAVHSDKTLIDDWNFEASKNKIEGRGDFNGDGRDDILISSKWGMGLISHKNNQWRTLVVKPKGTRFGGWTYNSEKDKMEAIADFDGDGMHEILISSKWGIGMLKKRGSSFRSIFAQPIGTKFGNWTYNSRSQNIYDNKIEGTGDFNGDGKADILVSKPYGIAILTLEGSTLNSILVKPNNTGFGEWNYNSGQDKIEAIADFDGDGKDEILISSNWGIGMLKLQGDSFISIFAKPIGTKFGSWTYNSQVRNIYDNTIEGTGDFNGDGKADILVSKPYGIAVLTLERNTLNSILVKPVGTNFGGWTYNTQSVRDNKIQQIADFNADGKDDILVSKPYGMGILSLSGNTFTSLYIKQNGKQIGPWHLKESNQYSLTGNFDGQPGQEILIYNWKFRLPGLSILR